MKSCTDIEQSKKLVEILPLESADMYYQYVLPKSDKIKHNPEIGNPVNALKWYNKGYTMSGKEPVTLDEYCIPCWSLTALLNVLPNGIDIIKEEADTENERYMCILGINDNIISTFADNPVDACFEVILKLKELKLLFAK